ncbi:DNA polymerase III subunit beta [Rickettsia endosymbiont of Gonocerus acuteangulatus]|uniref:DNA polymerase III subunit beta n=1 Tax=Rickettsia endosymbiont of Gonocerus acuteangulatus TaxID=3066266 RepID=UPI0031332ECB
MLKVIVETKTLVQALGFASSVVEKRNVISELANIKLSAKDGLLELSSTNMDLYLSQKIGVQVVSEGELTVSTKTLNDIVRKLPDSELTLTDLGTTGLEITGKNCRFNLFTLPVESFPVMDNINPEASFKISCAEFAKIIESTKFSVSLDETRYNLNGIYLHVKDGEFYAASTDGHRLSVSSVELAEKIDDFGVILPQKSAEEILKIVKDSKNANADIEILLSSNKIKFICNENVIMLSKLIDGTFPDYSSFIPENSSSKLVINRKIFADTIERIAIITVEKFRAVKLSLSGEALEISAIGEARGNAKEVINSSKETENFYEYSGETNLDIGFNPQYLEDVLKVIKSDLVELYFSSVSAPVLIKFPESPKDIFVVMPVKV